MSDPYASPFPDQYSGQRTRRNPQYSDRSGQYVEAYADQYEQYPEQQYAGQQYADQQYPASQPTAAYPSEHYSSQAYVTPETPTRRPVSQFPETGPVTRDRSDRGERSDRDPRPPKKTGTPLGRIVMGVFLGMLLWSIVVGLITLLLLASVAGRIENRLQDLRNSDSVTSTHTSSSK